MKIVVDIGATNTRVASSMDGKTLHGKKRFLTPVQFDTGVEKIVEAVEGLIKSSAITGLVVGVPGPINRDQKKVFKFGNIPSWTGKDIVKSLETELRSNLFLANDAELAALGEANYGSGKNFTLVAYLTISTGIGGSLVMDRKLVPSATNKEPGSMFISFEKEEGVPYEPDYDWEDYGAGPAFERRFGISPEDCNDPDIWRKHAAVIGRGLLNIIRLWSPEVIVIGGGLSFKGSLFFTPLVEYVQSHFTVFPPPPIVPGKLSDDAGLYGGLELLRTKEKV